MRVCNGIARCGLVAAANENAEGVYVAQDTGTICAENEGADGWYLIAPFGTYKHRVGLQQFDAAAANDIIANFNSRFQRLRRALGFGTTLPVHYGHPDVGDDGRPGISSRHLDQTVYGKVSDLTTSSEGLKAKIDWSEDFKQLPHGLRFSPFWLMKPLEKRGTYRPNFLKSIGLTATPNIPMTSAANENLSNVQTKENQMLKYIITQLGYSEEAAQKFIDNAEGAPSEDEIKAKFGALLDNAAKLEASEKKLKESEVAAENSRNAFADFVVNKAIKSGRLTEADREARTNALKTSPDIVAAANEIDALEVKFPTESETNELKKNDTKANAKKAFNDRVSKYEAEGQTHLDATMRAKREMPDEYKLAFES
ncbi:MAG: hypothetical protein IKS15_04620 [Opitutales bacterium]|nr:hypothetical protein [Opitutales bacterium]